jgi:hypothetical protein
MCTSTPDTIFLHSLRRLVFKSAYLATHLGNTDKGMNQGGEIQYRIVPQMKGQAMGDGE